MTTTPLIPCGRNLWKEESTIVAPATAAAILRFSEIKSRSFSASFEHEKNSAIRCLPRAFTFSNSGTSKQKKSDILLKGISYVRKGLYSY
jgi:hypothetical protein